MIIDSNRQTNNCLGGKNWFKIKPFPQLCGVALIWKKVKLKKNFSPPHHTPTFPFPLLPSFFPFLPSPHSLPPPSILLFLPFSPYPISLPLTFPLSSYFSFLSSQLHPLPPTTLQPHHQKLAESLGLIMLMRGLWNLKVEILFGHLHESKGNHSARVVVGKSLWRGGREVECTTKSHPFIAHEFCLI